MNIEIDKTNHFKNFLHKTHDKLEDILFSIIQKIPERFIPSFLMEHIERYIDKRTQELQEHITRQRWQQVHLEKAIEEIHLRYDREKAQKED